MIGAYEFVTNTPVRLDEHRCQVVQDVALVRTSPPLSPHIKASTSNEVMTERCVVVQRNHDGYGFTVTGDIPFYVDIVRKNGPAYCAGVREGDRILKVNGMPVSHSNQLDVIRMISGGQNVVLTLLGKTPNCLSINSGELAEASAGVVNQTTTLAMADSSLPYSDSSDMQHLAERDDWKKRRKDMVALSEEKARRHENYDLETKSVGSHNDYAKEPSRSDPFSNLSNLKTHPAHLAVFVKYLLMNKNPSSLFYYLITEAYQTIDGSTRDFRRWALELFTTFIVPNSPLSIPNTDQNIIQPIDKILAMTTEQVNESDVTMLKRSFVPGRQRAVQNINVDLQEFREARQSDFGMVVDVNQLAYLVRDDKSTESRVGEQLLFTSLENMVTPEIETSSSRQQAIVASMATLIRIILGKPSLSSWEKLLERCPQFLQKDRTHKPRKPPSFAKTKVQVKGHMFQIHTINTVHYCYHCRDTIWGMQPWCYFCSHCDVKIHLMCTSALADACYPAMQSKNKSIKSSRKSGLLPKSELSDSDLRHDTSKSTIFDSSLDIPEKTTVGRSQSVRSQLSSQSSTSKIVVDRSKRDQSWWGMDLLPADEIDEDDIIGTRSMDGRSESSRMVETTRVPVDLESVSSSVSHSSTTDMEYRRVVKRNLDDNDVDMLVELETPALESLIGWDVVKLLKPKEKKRQDFINELFHTERTHLRNLKILWKVFYAPLLSQNILSAELAQLLFSNLEEVIQVHSSINTKMMDAVQLFKRDPNLNGMYGSIGPMLESIFDGEDGEKLMQVTSTFCQHQQHALQLLRTKLDNKKDREDKLVRFLMVAESFSICRKLQLKDMLPVEMQRLVKYPLLLEGIAKYTQEPSDELDSIQRAIIAAKKTLTAVNTAKRNAENLRRLQELQSRIDTAPFDKEFVNHEYSSLDLSKYQLVHEGPLSCRFNRGKITELHVVLLESMLVMLTRHSDGNKLLLKCLEPSKETKWSPILPLAPLMCKEKANDKRSFFLVHNSQFGAQIFELVAPTATERKTWFRLLSEQIENDRKSRESGEQCQFDLGVRTAANLEDSDKVQILTHPQLVNASEITIHQPTALQHAEPVMTLSERLRRSDEVIFRALHAKQVTMSEMFPGKKQGKLEELNKLAEVLASLSVSDLKQKNGTELAMSAIVHGNRLLDSINNGMNQYKKREAENISPAENEPSVSCSELTAVAFPLMNHLKALMQVIQDQQNEISVIKQQLHHYKELADQGPLEPGPADRSVSEETLIDVDSSERRLMTKRNRP